MKGHQQPFSHVETPFFGPIFKDIESLTDFCHFSRVTDRTDYSLFICPFIQSRIYIFNPINCTDENPRISTRIRPPEL